MTWSGLVARQGNKTSAPRYGPERRCNQNLTGANIAKRKAPPRIFPPSGICTVQGVMFTKSFLSHPPMALRGGFTYYLNTDLSVLFRIATATIIAAGYKMAPDIPNPCHPNMAAAAKISNSDTTTMVSARTICEIFMPAFPIEGVALKGEGRKSVRAAPGLSWWRPFGRSPRSFRMHAHPQYGR